MPEYIKREEVLAQIEAKQKSIEASINCNYRAALLDVKKIVLNIPAVNATTQRNTHYDLIQNMSIDELAEVLYSANDKICFENCEKGTGNRFSCPIKESDIEEKHCLECMKRWLESVVTE